MLVQIAASAWAGLVGASLVLPVATLVGWWLARRPPPAWLEVLPWLVVLVPPGALPVGPGWPRVLAGAGLALPLATWAALAAFTRVGPRWALLGRALGDTAGQTLPRVDLPLAFPGLLAAAALAFARAATLEASGLAVGVPALLVFVSMRRTHDEALEEAGG